MGFQYTVEEVLGLMNLQAKIEGDEYRLVHNFNNGCGQDSLLINRNSCKAHCFSCDWGGNILTMYAEFYGMSNREARIDILERLNRNEQKPVDLVKDNFTKIRRVTLDPEHTDLVYRKVLDELELNKKHLTSLQNRGFTKENLDALSYRSAPTDNYECRRIARVLLNNGLKLSGVPGFYKQGKDWTFICFKSGILVPVKNYMGKIVGIQIRIDDDCRKLVNGKLEKKYRWISTKPEKGFVSGTAAVSAVHYACKFEDTPFGKMAMLESSIMLTEGPMKADLVHCLTGFPIIAIAGVNARWELNGALETCKTMGVQTIIDCLDMDYLTNKNVSDAMAKIRDMIDSQHLSYHRKNWDPQYKGIDDYYANQFGVVNQK